MIVLGEELQQSKLVGGEKEREMFRYADGEGWTGGMDRSWVDSEDAAVGAGGGVPGFCITWELAGKLWGFASASGQAER